MVERERVHATSWELDGYRWDSEIYRTPLTPPPAPKPVQVFGVQVHALWSSPYGSGAAPGPLLRQHLGTLRDHGVRLIRVDYGWSAGQPENKPLTLDPAQGGWYNARLATVLDLAHEHGMKVLVTVHQSPGWARPNTGTNVKQFPTDVAAWARFCDQFDKMFGPHPAFFAAEIWNEPNLEEFTGIADAAMRATRYAPLLDRAVMSMVCPVMFGGPSQCDHQFVHRALLEAAAARRPALWSVHPYMADQTIPPDDTSMPGSRGRVMTYPQVQDAFEAAGDQPIWWSEFGFSVHSNATVPASTPWKKGVPTEDVAADHLLRQMRLATDWGVAGVVVYCAYRDTGDQHVKGFSLIHADGTPTKQLLALRDYFGGAA